MTYRGCLLRSLTARHEPRAGAMVVTMGTACLPAPAGTIAAMTDTGGRVPARAFDGCGPHDADQQLLTQVDTLVRRSILALDDLADAFPGLEGAVAVADISAAQMHLADFVQRLEVAAGVGPDDAVLAGADDGAGNARDLLAQADQSLDALSPVTHSWQLAEARVALAAALLSLADLPDQPPTPGPTDTRP